MTMHTQLNARERDIVESLFRRAEVQVAMEVRDGRLHPGTALAVFATWRDVVRPLDPLLAERLVARATEAAASALAAQAISARLGPEDENAEAQRRGEGEA